MRPKFCISLALMKSEGAGKTGCAPHPRSHVRFAIGMLHMSIQVWRKHTGLPRAMALRLIRDRPGDPAFCDTIVLGQRWLPSNLTPASGRRTQTISPYAAARSSRVPRRPSLPCPAFATTADAPLVGQDGASYGFDLPDVASDLFLSKGLDLYHGVICPSGSLQEGLSQRSPTSKRPPWTRFSSTSTAR